MRKVVIISDCSDIAFLEMRGTIARFSKDSQYQIEPLVKVKNFSVENAAFLTRLIAENYPDNTIIMVIVNAEQDRPERVIGKTKNKSLIFEGPNTGAFEWLLRDFGSKEVYEIFDDGFVPFGGKYVHSPTVGKYLSGIKMNELGTPFPIDNFRKSKITNGTVVHIDNFGNAKIYSRISDAKDGDKFNVKINEKIYHFIFWTRMMEREDNELIIYPGSSLGLIEIGQVRNNLTETINIEIGDIVQIRKGS